MKRKKYRILGIFIAIILLIAVGFVVFRLLSDENNLTIKERNYINNSRSSLIDIRVLSTSNVFSSNGRGVFYDFLNSFEKKYNLSFNKIYVSENDNVNSLALTKGKVLPNKARVFYVDHYVLVSESFVNIYENNINGIIGALKTDLASLNNNLKAKEFKTYDSKDELLKGLAQKEVTFIAVPMIEYLDIILENLYHIVYHISDMKDY